jgi:hypothetical protein
MKRCSKSARGSGASSRRWPRGRGWRTITSGRRSGSFGGSDAMTDSELHASIIARTMPIPECGCWIWMGHVDAGGYGRVRRRRKSHVVHRLLYCLDRGDVPPGLDLDHKCRVRSCCNPDHLEPVTRRENVRRGVGTAAVNMRKTHCAMGHELAGDNLDPESLALGRRRCRTCRVAYLGKRLQQQYDERRRRGARQNKKMRPSMRLALLGDPRP